MITNNNSWSLGTTPNKSLDPFGPSIPIHLPGDPLVNDSRTNRVLRTQAFRGAGPFRIQCIRIRVHSCPFVVSLPPQPLDLTLFNAF